MKPDVQTRRAPRLLSCPNSFPLLKEKAAKSADKNRCGQSCDLDNIPLRDFARFPKNKQLQSDKKYAEHNCKNQSHCERVRTVWITHKRLSTLACSSVFQLVVWDDGRGIYAKGIHGSPDSNSDASRRCRSTSGEVSILAKLPSRLSERFDAFRKSLSAERSGAPDRNVFGDIASSNISLSGYGDLSSGSRRCICAIRDPGNGGVDRRFLADCFQPSAGHGANRLTRDPGANRAKSR
jgi:hypothetical protein